MVSPMETKLTVLLRAQGADQQEHPALDGDVPHMADLEQESPKATSLKKAEERKFLTCISISGLGPR